MFITKCMLPHNEILVSYKYIAHVKCTCILYRCVELFTTVFQFIWLLRKLWIMQALLFRWSSSQNVTLIQKSDLYQKRFLGQKWQLLSFTFHFNVISSVGKIHSYFFYVSKYLYRITCNCIEYPKCILYEMVCNFTRWFELIIQK